MGGPTPDYSRTDPSALTRPKQFYQYKATLETSTLKETITHFTAPCPPLGRPLSYLDLVSSSSMQRLKPFWLHLVRTCVHAVWFHRYLCHLVLSLGMPGTKWPHCLICTHIIYKINPFTWEKLTRVFHLIFCISGGGKNNDPTDTESVALNVEARYWHLWNKRTTTKLIVEEVNKDHQSTLTQWGGGGYPPSGFKAAGDPSITFTLAQQRS